MTRRLVLPAALLFLLVLPGLSARADTPAPPNIVYILADDLGYGDLGCYNSDSKIPTPNLDQLAREGMRFTDAHAPTSVCTPTRYAILTGRYCWRSRLKSGVLAPWGATLIEPDRLTVAALLKKHGYATAAIGKWHLGWEWPTKDGKPPQSGPDRLSNVDFTKPIGGGPTTRGFDYCFGPDLPNYPPYCFLENDRTVGIPSEPSTAVFNRPGPMLKGWDWVEIMPELTRRAIRYVEDRGRMKQQPFFLYFPLTAPHFPVVPAAEFKGKSKAGDYGDFVVQVDATVGRLLDALKRAGFADNTLVIFTSDNGPEVTGEVRPGVYDRIREHGHASMGQLRGAKRDAWEGGHRVPFLARWPGKIKPGTESKEIICEVDFLATVAAILGAKLPDSAAEDSYNLLPVLLNEKRDGPIREATVHHSAKGHFAIRKGEWVLIDSPSGDDNKEPEWFKKERGYRPHDQPGELFRLDADLAEGKNVYAENPDKVRELQALLAKYRKEGRSAPVSSQKKDGPGR